MATATKPRASDVAQWVASLTAPEPSRWMAEDHKQWRRAKDHARGMLRSWDLDDAGKPIVREPAAALPGLLR